MTAVPAQPWHPGTSARADDPARDEDVCLTCGVAFTWADGWDGECLECAVLSQEHLAGGHAQRATAACRRCS